MNKSYKMKAKKISFKERKVLQPQNFIRIDPNKWKNFLTM